MKTIYTKNGRYNKQTSDVEYLAKITKTAQRKIDSAQELHGAEYCVDGMKDEILIWLDDNYIYPDDIDRIMADLEF